MTPLDRESQYLANVEVRLNLSITKRRRRRTVLWFSATAAVCALLYWEQSALLYVLSTLAMCVFLLVVAFSNLEARDQEVQQLEGKQDLDMTATPSDERAA